MAQVLKEELRFKIVESAKKELLEKGYRDASMRNIATMADTTVGNLYRYFENKDQLIHVIIEPTVMKLDKIIQKGTEERISLYQNAQVIGYAQEDIVPILDRLAAQLMMLYKENKEEMTILMIHSEHCDHMIEWFAQLIQVLANETFAIDESHLDEVYLLSRMIAVSVIHGLQECFRLSDTQEGTNTDLAHLVQIYFRCFVSMLNTNFIKMKEVNK